MKNSKRIIFLGAFFFGTAMFLAPAHAQLQDAGVPDASQADASPQETIVERAESAPGSMAMDLADAVKKGQWRMVIAMVLSFALVLLGKFRDKVKWFKGDRGGAVLALMLSLGGAAALALASDATLDLRLALGALGVTWTAVGGYTWVKRLIWPKDAPDTNQESTEEVK